MLTPDEKRTVVLALATIDLSTELERKLLQILERVTKPEVVLAETVRICAELAEHGNDFALAAGSSLREVCDALTSDAATREGEPKSWLRETLDDAEQRHAAGQVPVSERAEQEIANIRKGEP